MQSSRIICPICNDSVDKLVYSFHLNGERQVLEQIRQQYPEWTINDGICSRCVDYYHTQILLQQRVLPEVGPYFPVRSVDDFVILPTGLRLDADQRFTGKGVTICFIDSGFYPHPDLTDHRNRIKAIIDITASDTPVDYFLAPRSESWHGTITSVVCAGDGFLSNGLYRGIAFNAELVLLKVQDAEGKISAEYLETALKWVLKHGSHFDIRIVNISLGVEEATSFSRRFDELIEELVLQGVVVVAAVGNDEHGSIKPPANSRATIAVGGLDDENRIEHEKLKLYHSSYGATTESLFKPDLVAPAIWIAAPILPQTKEQIESETLHYLIKLKDGDLLAAVSDLIGKTELNRSILSNSDPAAIREVIRTRIQVCKYISGHYMHVDGTSFAAPIVSSVIAQLLEAQPDLTPSMIRQILYGSAKRLDEFPVVRQGFGMIRPKQALFNALKHVVSNRPYTSPQIDTDRQTVAFYLEHNCAEQVALAGSFNHWAKDVLLFELWESGIWKIEIPMLPAGKYRYKFLVDEKRWLEDIHNPYREPDGFSGFNSILLIES